MSADRLPLDEASESSERPELEDRLGSEVGGYILERVVGSGGMGVVYRARSGETGRVVALKLMLPEVASNHRFRERFVLESQAAPDLDHPHIVPVFEVGEARRQLFIAMRLVEGPDLKEIIEREGALEPHRALGILRQAAAALDHSHERGMVHRDVKPQNFLLASTDAGEDHVYLTDFGLVKPTSGESTASRTTDVFGSIQYMSPEQIEAMPVDGRADVYSLACVAFECLTGQPPFERPNEMSLLWAHVHEDPPRPTDVRPSLPGGLDLVLRQAMSKHPDDRYLTCGEFVDALQEGLKHHRRQLVVPAMRPLVKRIPRPKTEREVWAPNFFPELSRVRKLTDRTNWVQVTAVTAILSLLAASFVHFGRAGGIPQAAADVADLVQEAAADVADAVDTNEDAGSRPVASSQEDSRPRSLLRPSVNERSGLYDGLLVPGRPGKSKLPMAVQSGTASGGDTVVAPPAPQDPKIVWMRSYDVWVMKEEGTSETRLTSSTHQEWFPTFSPDGDQILYRVYSGSSGPSDVNGFWTMRSDGSHKTQILECEKCASPSWAPSGRRFVFVGDGSLMVGDLRGRTRTLIEMESLEPRFDSGPGPSWSPDGRGIAFGCRADGGAGKNNSLCTIRPDGSNFQVIFSGGHNPARTSWSPDGGRIAFEQGRAPTCDAACTELFIINRDGSGLRQLTSFTTVGAFDPTWAGSDRIVYSGFNNDTGGEIYMIDADRAGVPSILTDRAGFDIQPDWWGPAE